MSIRLGLWVVVFFLCPVPFFSFVVSMSQALFLFLFCLYLFPFDMKNPPGLSSQLSYMHVYFLFFDVVFCSNDTYISMWLSSHYKTNLTNSRIISRIIRLELVVDYQPDYQLKAELPA